MEKQIEKSTLPTEKIQLFAVFSYLNHQYIAVVGEKISIPFSDQLKKDAELIFDKILVTNNLVGTPYLNDYIVTSKVIEPLKKEKKITVFKYKAKKDYRLKKGHRQKKTVVQIVAIGKHVASTKSRKS